MKVYIGSIVGRYEETEFSQSMRLLWMELSKRGIPFMDGTVRGDALISRSRSIAASAFLRSDADVLLTIDSDIFFRAEDAVALCEKAMERGCIGGMYMTRALKTQPALLLPDDQEILFAPDSEPVEIQFISTGFMAIRRDVFEKLSEGLPKCHQGWSDKGADTSFWPFYMPFVIPWEGDEGNIYLSEDWAFCERARGAGFSIWLDPSIRLGHIGDVMYTMEDLVRPPRPAPQPLTLSRQHDGALTTKLMAQGAHPALSQLPEHVHEYLNLNGKPLADEFAWGREEMAKLWKERPRHRTERQFYEREDVGQAYLRDLAGWHLSGPIAGGMIRYLRGIQGEKVLDYGSGIGTMALMLASQQNHVHCIEPNQVMRDFTDWRAGRLGVRIRWEQEPPQDCDMAICWHVLEHVPNPEEVAAEVVGALKPGGRLFTESDFTDDGRHPMHHTDPDDPRGESYWAKLGLIRENEFWWRKEAATATT